VDQKKLKVALVERALSQWQLARRLGLAPSSLSDYVRGARPAPADLQQRVERELRMHRGALT
jgi:predicted transcriptional regulator